MTNLGILTIAGLSGTSAIGLIFLNRHLDQQARDANRVVYRLNFPPDLAPSDALVFVRGLTSLQSACRLNGRDSLVLEVLRLSDGIEHRLRVPRQRTQQVLAQLTAAVPGLRPVRIDECDVPTPRFVVELRLTSLWPLRTDSPAAFAGHLLHTLAASDVGTGEGIAYQLVVYPVGSPKALPTTSLPGGSLLMSWLRWPAQAFGPSGKPNGRGMVAHREKLREPLFGVGLRVGARAASRRRSRQLVGRVVGTTHQLARPGVMFSRRHVLPRLAASRLCRAATPIAAPPLWVNAQELAVLTAWPFAGPTVPGLRLAGGRVFPPSPDLPTTGRVYGRATYPGLERPVGVSVSDTRMHTLLLGPTGSGKSTTMLNLIVQDLAAGRGLVLIDPNVHLAEDLIARIPPRRVHDLIYLNPAGGLAVPLNPLDCAPEDAELVADQVLEIIRDRSLSWGVTIDELLRNTLVLLAATPGMTMTEIPVVLRDEAFRLRLLSNLTPALQTTVGEFFAAFASRTQLQQTQDIAAVLNKVSPLVDRSPIRAMLGQAELTWTMRQVMDDSKILTVALPSGVISPVAADIIGSLVVRMVWNAVLGRAVTDHGPQRPVTVYIDELARFVGSGSQLADMLARARGFGLDVVGALQHLAQAPPKLQAALLSEARNKLILQPAADDARLLARHLPGVTAEDLMALPPHSAIGSLVAAGRVTSPVTLALADAPPESGCGPAALAAARKYGRRPGDVERMIRDRRQHSGSGGSRRIRRLP